MATTARKRPPRNRQSSQHEPAVQPEQSMETMSDEVQKFLNNMLGANVKGTYDIFQLLNVGNFLATGMTCQRMLSDAVSHSKNIDGISQQILQNAVTNADNTQKQYLKAEKVGTDAFWNDIEDASGNAITAKAVQLDDIARKLTDVAGALAGLTAAAGRPVTNPTGTVPTPAPARGSARARRR